ncbi:S-adenosylmethionine tRNA ribosyltransferase [Mycobacterium sp. 1423905.2]|nr:S-adenosylmethionine tRNA ribosyltransferase [Mycobacterium sp. 1423905.2]
MNDGPVGPRLRSAILALARHRGPDSSTCPSDAARAVGGEDWRALMDEAREIARELARSGAVEITQRGAVVDPDATWRGPIRIRTTR